MYTYSTMPKLGENKVFIIEVPGMSTVTRILVRASVCAICMMLTYVCACVCVYTQCKRGDSLTYEIRTLEK